jgi:SAM-dependent methyltransferase
VSASRSFGAVADLYERARPSYPAGALDAVLPAGARRVVDVGAGTGKLTAVLVARGLDVIAVEPDDRMREVLAAAVPQADVRAGTAEQLPLAGEEVQAVLFGQAWHWADPDRAAREASRVLTDAGVLAMLWNLHDDRVAWVAELNRLTGSGAAFTAFDDPPELPGFDAGVRVDVAWSNRLSKDDVLGLVRTWSSVSTRPAPEQEQILDGVRRLVENDPQLATREVIELPYVCGTYAYRLTDSRPTLVN